MEQLIQQADYTSEINSAISELRYLMQNTGIGFDADTIKVFRDGNFAYVLANPIVGAKLILDNDGNPVEMPLYNITALYTDNFISHRNNPIVFNGPNQLRIIRPELCKRIELAHNQTG